jgi:hypothetical protein
MTSKIVKSKIKRKIVKTDNMGRSPNYGRNSNILIPDPIETGTAMNARESENYLPISRSFSASK